MKQKWLVLPTNRTVSAVLEVESILMFLAIQDVIELNFHALFWGVFQEVKLSRRVLAGLYFFVTNTQLSWALHAAEGFAK